MASSAIPKLFAASARHVLVKSHASGEVAGSGYEAVSSVVVGITTISVGVGNNYSSFGRRLSNLIHAVIGASGGRSPSQARALAQRVARMIAPAVEKRILSVQDHDRSREGRKPEEQNTSASSMIATYKTLHQRVAPSCYLVYY